MFRRILIANRGEIAVRIFRACREMNIQPVVVYSQGDADALHVQLAEEAYCIGPARSADSYLNMNAILTVAKQTGCDALHPGYGFLSENADFADACAQAGIAFIGPSGDVIRKMGNKAAARKLMQKAGVPVVPGSDGAVETPEQAKALADAMGYPVLIKAAAGGGGRGMRRVYEPDQLIPLFQEARSESIACFGSDEMYLEKLIVNPRQTSFSWGSGTAPSSGATRRCWRNPPPRPSPPSCGSAWGLRRWRRPRRPGTSTPVPLNLSSLLRESFTS